MRFLLVLNLVGVLMLHVFDSWFACGVERMITLLLVTSIDAVAPFLSGWTPLECYFIRDIFDSSILRGSYDHK